MAELKTRPTASSVEEFLDAISDPQRRQDCYVVLGLMKQATQAEPRMWGSAIVGFGDYRYRYASGRSGDWFLAGFSPRKDALTLYVTTDLEQYRPYLQRLGKHKTGKGCLYIKKLADVDLATLRDLINASVRALGGGPAPVPSSLQEPQ